MKYKEIRKKRQGCFIQEGWNTVIFFPRLRTANTCGQQQVMKYDCARPP